MDVQHTYEENVQLVLEEAATVQKKADRLVSQFYVNHEKADIISIINLIISKGNPKNREFLEEFKRKYEVGDISLQEIGRYNDLYDLHKPLLVEEGK